MEAFFESYPGLKAEHCPCLAYVRIVSSDFSFTLWLMDVLKLFLRYFTYQFNKLVDRGLCAAGYLKNLSAGLVPGCHGEVNRLADVVYVYEIPGLVAVTVNHQGLSLFGLPHE